MRLIAGTAVTVAVLAAGPGVARACNNPELTLSTAGAAAGEVVYWAISDAQLGAEYQVSVNGRIVQSTTTVTEPKPTGSFVMQDYGDRPLSITVSSVVSHDHEGGPWRDDDTLQYRPPSPPPADAPTQAAPAPGSEAQENGPGTTPVSRGESNEPVGRDPSARTRTRLPSTAPRTRVQATNPVETAADPAPAAAPATAAPAVGARAGAASVGAIAAGAPEQKTGMTRLKRAAREASPGLVSERAAPGSRPPQPVVDKRAAGGERAPALPAIGFGALALAGTAALVAMLLRRRGGSSSPVAGPPAPSPPDVVIEAELQEIVAEGRQRLLEHEHRHELPEPGEPIRAGPS